MEQTTVIKSLAALAQGVRLQAFRAMVVAGKDGLTPGAIAETLGVPANTLSFHLKELTYAGLVSQERVSRNIVYRVNFDQVKALLGYLTENCCEGATCAVDPKDSQCVC